MFGLGRQFYHVSSFTMSAVLPRQQFDHVSSLQSMQLAWL
jgi:hypothetical protein